MRSLFSNEGLNSGAHCESTGLTHWTTRAFPELGRLDYFEHRSDGPSGGGCTGSSLWGSKEAGRRSLLEACSCSETHGGTDQNGPRASGDTFLASETVLKLEPVGFPKIWDHAVCVRERHQGLD